MNGEERKEEKEGGGKVGVEERKKGGGMWEWMIKRKCEWEEVGRMEVGEEEKKEKGRIIFMSEMLMLQIGRDISLRQGPDTAPEMQEYPCPSWHLTHTHTHIHTYTHTHTHTHTVVS